MKGDKLLFCLTNSPAGIQHFHLVLPLVSVSQSLLVIVLLLFFLSLGILHKGNGENQFISQQPPVIGSIMGNGRRRSISCPSCNGLADGNKLLAPVALTCGSDGSLYVGDFNYIRRIFPSGNVTNILELRYAVLNVAIIITPLSSAETFCIQMEN